MHLKFHSNTNYNSQDMEATLMLTDIWTDEWIKKMWYIHTEKYYSALKENEMMSFVATWMDLEIIILSAVRQRQIPCITYQIRSVAQSCPTLCDPMNRSTPGLPVHQLPEFTQTHVHRVSDAIQPSHPLSSPSPPALNPFNWPPNPSPSFWTLTPKLSSSVF